MLRSHLRPTPVAKRESTGTKEVTTAHSTSKDYAAEFSNATPQSFEPKVLVPFEHQRGRVPRKIEVERRRRMYEAQDVEKLLSLAGLQLARSKQQLPIEIFDDTSFDCRNLSEWMSIAKSGSSDNSRFLPAQAIRWASGTSYKLELCRVVDWNPKSNMLKVFWGATDLPQAVEETSWVARIFVRLLAEDPIVFVQRLVAANEKRHQATERIKYRLSCDSMPTDGLPGIDMPVEERILKLGRGIPQLAPKVFPDVVQRSQKLVKEFALEWRRAHNKIALEHRLESDAAAQRLVEECTKLPAKSILAQSALAQEHPSIIQIPQGGFNFEEKNVSFTFASYYTQPEVVGALTGIRNECIKVLNQSLFHLPKERQMTLAAFEKLQHDAMDTMSTYLKTTWKQAICDVIQKNFASVGKGWLNVQEKSQAIYEESKLRKFFTTVKYMMEDTLFQLVYESLQDFTTFFEEVSAFTVTVKDMTTVLNSWPGSDAPDAVEKQPLFTLELAEKEGAFSYSNPPPSFLATIVELFDRAIDATRAIPQVEKYVMTQYFWKSDSEGPFLETVNREEERVWLLRERLRECVQESLSPLTEYLETYNELLDIVTLDKQEYIKEFAAEEHSTEDMKEEIRKHIKAKKTVPSRIPFHVVVGNFIIDCHTFKLTIANKIQELAKLVMDLICQIAKAKTSTIRDEFHKITTQVQRPPTTVEKLYETRAFITALPEQVLDLKVKIDDMRTYYSILEGFQYGLTDEDFKCKWDAIGWPKKLDGALDNENKKLDAKSEEFHEKMVADQESFGKEVDKLARIVATFSKFTDSTQAAEVAVQVKKLNDEIKKCVIDSRDFNNKQRLFAEETTDYRNIIELEKEFKPYSDLWLTTAKWQDAFKKWHTDPFDTLDPEDIDATVQQSAKTMGQLGRTFRDKMAMLKIVDEVKKSVEDFRPVVPIAMALRNPGMKERHWEGLSDKLNTRIIPMETLNTLQDCYPLVEHKDVIVAHCEVAAKEYQIEKTLREMQAKWQSRNFVIDPYKSTRTYILKESAEVIELLDEHLNVTQQLQFSHFKAFFAEEIDKWEHDLNMIYEILEQWLECQRAWRYLEPIFSSEDIAVQLPKLSKLFEKVDRTWRKIMYVAHQSPNVLQFCLSGSKVLDQFTECNKNLEIVQKGLNDYLQDKRQAFPRFYFLSDEELLEILSQSKDPRNIDRHLRKLFEFIQKMEWNDASDMIGFYSTEGEYCPQTKPVTPKGNVENWLVDVEKEMKESVHAQVRQAVEDYTATKRTDWVLKWPGQVVSAVALIYWTSGTEKALNEEGTVQNYSAILHDQLMDLVDVVQSPLNSIKRIDMGALITIEVHAKDTIDNMVAANVSDVKCFDWSKQLRFYFEEDNFCHVRQVDAYFTYGGEYLGNSARLVVTPLTDRIYLTLTGALALCLGGAPAGPAGTGKTETVKDLAKAAAKQCVVFNCQEGMTYASMGKFFKGLAWAGAWACFDEFNRIDIEVLSVIAQQVSDLQYAAVTRQYKIDNFEGSEVILDPTYAIFITMNPGYAGRTELPDNLKVLFRPVACMVPDYALIAEIRLFSFGYKKARNLAQKMVITFKLSSEQLSSQDHYDFGMRAVNTVISAAGLNKRNYPDMNEDLLLLRALKDSNVPKFLRDDIQLFEGIISDLFPGAKLPDPDNDIFKSGITATIAERNQQPIDEFILKTFQLYDVTVLRHGLMLVGPTGSGKSSIWKTLQGSMTFLAKKQEKGELKNFNQQMMKVFVHECNPKSMKLDQLYGAYDRNTGEWNDGILCVLFRAAAYADPGAKHWVLFDGPVDAMWIESMNTVLDDNKKLCLVSGEIIQMSREQTMMFEVEDLAVASPATVSRCGMIYMEPESCVPTWARVKSWINSLPAWYASFGEEVSSFALNYLDPLILFVRRNLREYVPTVDNNLVHSFFRMMNSYIATFTPPPAPKDAKIIPQERLDIIEKCNKQIALLSLVWSVGASCTDEGRDEFSVKFREMMSEFGHAEYFPEDGSVYDYTFQYSAVPEDEFTPVWKVWEETKPPFQMKQRLPYFDIIVPTVDTIRQNYIVYHLLTHQCHVAAVGPTGTGKSVSIIQMIMRELPEKFQGLSFTFSAQTSSNVLQNSLMSKFDKRRSHIFGAPTGKYFVCFIDDTNLPQKEKFGAQPPIELLRQIIGQGGMYTYQPPIKYNQIVDVIFVLAMGPPGGGRNQLTNRFMRFFNYVAFPELSTASMSNIFTTIMRQGFRFSKANDEIAGLGPAMVDATLGIFKKCCKSFVPTPVHVHYSFNLRDVSRVFAKLYEAEQSVLKNRDVLVRLWVHEIMRVFNDRLINEEDCATLLDFVSTELVQRFAYEGGYNQLVTAPRLIYGDYANLDGRRVFEEISNMEHLMNKVNECLLNYNDEIQPAMNLVLFLDAIEHVSRISRILRMPNGHALLLGLGGSGRKSMCRLAVFMAESMEVFTVEITKNYGVKEWRESLGNLLLECGKEDKRICFLFNDTQIIKSTFLEDVASLLTSGDIPNLFEDKEIEAINEKFKPVCLGEGLPTTKISMYARFIKEVRNNLHLVLAFSPIGEVFRERMRMFPALINNCTIDWFADWPAEALLSVARYQVEQSNVDFDNTELVKNICESFEHLHCSAAMMVNRFFVETKRRTYVTPTSYLLLLQYFFELLKRKRKFLIEQKQRLENGLEKLRETEARVADLEAELRAKQPILKQTQEEIKVMMEKLAVDRAIAAEKQVHARKEEAEASKKADECAGIRKKCADRLAEAEPMLKEAVKVLKTLKAKEITELGNYKNPPQGVKYVMEAVTVFLNYGDCPKECYRGEVGKKEPDWWLASKQWLRDGKLLLETLTDTYDKEKMDDRLMGMAKKYVEDAEFTPLKVKDVSLPCMAMCSWVHAMYTWFHVNKEVLPLRVALGKAEAELALVTDALNETRAKLKEVEDSVAALQVLYEQAVTKQQALEKEVEITSQKLNRAGRLIDGLGGERQRWIDLLAKYVGESGNVIGDMLLAAGTVAYFGPFTTAYRKDLFSLWLKQLDTLSITHSKNCDFFSTCGNPVDLQQWQVNGLPTDPLSTENALILVNARGMHRWPLLIDPQGQANQWIRNSHKEENLQICKLSDSNYVKVIEAAVRLGYPCLLENVGEVIEPALDPILLHQTFLVGGAPHIRVGDSQVPIDEKNFKFYMTTKLPNPVYSPESIVKVNLLNFFITPGGLEDQLLGKTVEIERKDLEELKRNLTRSNAEKSRELQKLQDEILIMMQEAKGDILENEALINTLEMSKKKSVEINEDIAKARLTEANIDETRNKYRPHARRGSILFFCVAAISSVDPMYQFSLQWMMNLFIGSIDKAERSDDLTQRISNLKEHFLYSFYSNVCRSLFEQHKLTFSFSMCSAIARESGLIDEKEYRVLLAGATESGGSASNPAPDWLTDSSWNEIQFAAKTLPNMAGFDTHVATHIQHYKELFDSTDAHTYPLCGEWKDKCTPLQRLLITRLFRLDKMCPGIQEYIREHIGEKYVFVPAFSLLDAYKDSDPCTPLIFIISTGSDPMSEWRKFADQMRMGKKCVTISLGQGQGPKAMERVKEGVERGTWVLLQNCHLATSWMPTLEQLVENFNPDQVKKEFRLWLTSMPSDSFPVSVLQISVKMTNEPPKGLRANVNRSYFGLKEDDLVHTSKPSEFKLLLFAECLFHGVIQERRRFGALGFNIPYEFNDSDRNVCLSQLRKFLELYSKPPFDVLMFLTGEINYGGRVTDNWDRRCLMTLIDDYMKPSVLRVGYAYSPSGIYQSIEPGNRQYYLDHMASWPVNASPEVFGLHDNADITSARNDTMSLCKIILSLGAASSTMSTQQRDAILQSTALSIQEKVPPVFSIFDFYKKYPTRYEESMNTVVVQEAMRYNRLLQRIRSTLKEFLRAIKGEVQMSVELEDLGNSMFVYSVPTVWAAVGYPSLMPLSSWTNDLVRRCEFITKWYNEGAPPAFWMGGFFFPQAFLTGTLQNYARQIQQAIDTINFSFNILDVKPVDITQPAEKGAFIFGLFLEGARWDAEQKVLGESRPKELFTEFPPMHIDPIVNKPEAPNVYTCPVYKTLTRAGTLSTTGHSTNFVLPIEIPTKKDPSHWIKRGVACLLGLNV